MSRPDRRCRRAGGDRRDPQLAGTAVRVHADQWLKSAKVKGISERADTSTGQGRRRAVQPIDRDVTVVVDQFGDISQLPGHLAPMGVGEHPFDATGAKL
jgi:hypothetical protein